MASPYLCQVSTRVSCGACCGLYNVHNLTREGLETALTVRTEAFARLPREPEAIEDFGRRQLGWTPEERPFPHFHHCPFVGLIGRENTRVGCLLHPEAPGNRGRDWRELSYYGAKACRTYFCPTSRELSAEHQQIICQGIDHWYLYGLVITEHRLWAAFFREMERRVDRRTTAEDFHAHAQARQGLNHFAALKLAWPFRRAGAHGPCHYFFDDESYPRLEVERMDQALPESPYEAIFRELESCFMDAAAQLRAEAIVETILEGTACALSDKQEGRAADRHGGPDDVPQTDFFSF